MKRPIGLDALVIGGGWLGTRLARVLGAELVRPDITNEHAVRTILKAHKRGIVINAAGRAGPPESERGKPGVPDNIDWCNLSWENRAATMRSNVYGPEVLGHVCNELGIRLAHLSSGCIFDGPSPGPKGWTETDTPCPVSFYATTKIWGEEKLAGMFDELIIRLRLPVDAYPHPRNLITKLAGYPKVIDVVNSVTCTGFLWDVTRTLLEQEATGVFHVTNPGPVTHRQIMEWYCELVDPSHRYEMVPADEIRNLASEPRSNCVLDTSKLERYGYSPDKARAETIIRQYLRAYAKHPR